MSLTSIRIKIQILLFTLARTAINVTGDATVATVVAKTEGELADVKKAA